MIEGLTGLTVAGLTVLLVGTGVLWALLWRFSRRDRRRAAASKRHWELQRQQRDMEQQIRDEQRSPEEIEWDRQAKARAAEVRREARRRLGLPEEDSPS